MMRFRIVHDPQETPYTEIHFGNLVGLNLEALSRLINHSGLSYRRISEILGISELELEETLIDLTVNGHIEMLVEATQKRFMDVGDRVTIDPTEPPF